MIGKTLVNLKLEFLLGSGGMGNVYKALDTRLQRPVAIKLIDNRDGSRTQYVDKLLQEACLAASWRHENVTQIYYADEQNGFLYFVMEFIDGQDLAKLLEGFAADGELVGHKDIIMISQAVASALDYAHRKGVVHREVKPSNVMIDREGWVYLTDFGLAGLHQAGKDEDVFGTAHYMAPEQVRQANNVGPAADIYAFGVMLYEMLTGAVPFDDPNPHVVPVKHLNQEPLLPRSINSKLTPQSRPYC